MTTARYALRRLRRTPTFSIAVILSLVIGIAASVAVVQLMRGVILRDPPYSRSAELFVVKHRAARAQLPADGVSLGLFHYYEDNARTMAALGAYLEKRYAITDRLGDAEDFDFAQVTPSLLGLLGVAPIAGRLFIDADAQRGAPRVVILGYALWSTRYSGDREIIGRTIEIDRTPYTVVGIMPQGFAFPSSATDAWLPLWVPPVRPSLSGLHLTAVARIPAGPDGVQQAQTELNQLLQAIAPSAERMTEDPAADDVSVEMIPLKEFLLGKGSLIVGLLTGGALLVLLTTILNGMNLFLARSETRRTEIAVSMAFGATRRQAAADVLAEGAIVGVAALLVALPLARAIVVARFGFTEQQVPGIASITFGWQAMLMGGVIALVSVCLVTVPAIIRLRQAGAAGDLLRGASRFTAGRAAARVRRTLVCGQVAFSFLLAVSAGLLVESFMNVRSLDVVLRGSSSYMVRVPLSPVAYGGYAQSSRAVSEMRAVLARLPGVTAVEAGSASTFPLQAVPSYYDIEISRTVPQTGEVRRTTATFGFATPEYFRQIGIPVLSGRPFEASDIHTDRVPVMLSRSAAELVGDSGIVGSVVHIPGAADSTEFEVIGVVADVHSKTLRSGPTPALYFPNVFPLPRGVDLTETLYLIPNDEVLIVNHAGVRGTRLEARIDNAIRDYDPKIAAFPAQRVSDLLSGAEAESRFTMLIMLLVSAATIMIAVVGVYGLIAYATAQRRDEMGVRMALGARPRQLTWLIARDGARLAVIGVALGAIVALWGRKLLDGLLFGVGGLDPALLVLTGLVLVSVTLAASYLPARSIARLDPARALRGDGGAGAHG